MAMRMTGMMSGMDTESIIQQLVAARQTKVDAKKKEQTRIDWKQEAWKELNTKLKKLQTKYLSTMRFADAYSKKTTKVSNSNAVSVITGENAVNGVQSLEISQLAKTGYLTGGEIKDANGNRMELTALSSVKDIMGSFSGEGTFTVKTGNGYTDIKVTEDTTISDILNQFKDAGLNATFDAKNARFFVSAPESGAKNDFSITASDGQGATILSKLGLQTKIGNGEGEDAASYQEYIRYAGYFVAGDRAGTIANMRSVIDADIEEKKNSYLNQYKNLITSKADAEKTLDGYNTDLAKKRSELNAATSQEDKDKLQKEVDDLQEKITGQQTSIAKYTDQLTEIKNYAGITDDGNGNYAANGSTQLTQDVENRYYDKAAYAALIVTTGATGDKEVNLQGEATKTSGQDAEIILNGAKFTNNSNTFEINGLTFTALDETKGEKITVTTKQDTDGIYDMIKNFLKEYNEIVNEMDKLYNADRAKGYEPLTDEEKEAMSEKEVEKWETKIKDSILRRDDNLSTVNSALQSIMASGIEVNGKTMYLYDFGIETLGYFEAADNEKHAYHIAGDPDDEFTMNSEDKLKSMIANDPDTVISFFSQLGKNMYEKMFDMSKSVNGYRSFGNFYDDKKMQSDYDSYTTKIKEMETKLAEYEDKWYRKFSKMETALAKMQSNMSAITGLLGG